MKTLVIDNYDSFTYNLVHILREVGGDENLDIYRNDAIDLDEIKRYDRILLSPGPGLPQDSGILKELVAAYAHDKSILGICLGHQAVAEVFGAQLYNMSTVLHGVSTKLKVLKPDALFHQLPTEFKVCRYHSWAIDPNDFGTMEVTAVDDQGEIMAVAHPDYSVRGVQFHPESILTEYGIKMIDNWIKL